MKLTLPQRRGGIPAETLDVDPGTSMVIIGANGAGKTRFTDATAHAIGDKAARLSALDGLYNRRQASEKEQPRTPLENLLARLLHDEMVNLIGFKIAKADGKNAELRSTRLDKVIALWQEVFPGNRVLIDSGKILFTRGIGHEDDAYSALKLSDGEKAVLYYAASVLYAPKGAVVFVDSPEIFLHPTLTIALWNRLEAIRTDCAFCYTTHDPEFATSRPGATVVWVRDCDSRRDAWDYDILPSDGAMSQELYMTLVGARKPVLFIEGDGRRSIDAKLYPLIFPDFTVQSLGSCNKVIEATRTFNDLASFHKMDSMGIVDRDRRDEPEVAYLRRKRIMVPEVAEIENILLLEDVVKAMARATGHNPDRVFDRVRHTIVALFKGDLRQQALQHTRHKVKRTVEYRVDARFADITTLENHIMGLVDEISPRQIYEGFCREFRRYADSGDYEAILKVFNQKSMLSSSNVAPMCGFKNKDEYIRGIIDRLHHSDENAEAIRDAIRRCLQG